MRRRHREMKQIATWTQVVWLQSLHTQPIRNKKNCQGNKQPLLAMLQHSEPKLFRQLQRSSYSKGEIHFSFLNFISRFPRQSCPEGLELQFFGCPHFTKVNGQISKCYAASPGQVAQMVRTSSQYAKAAGLIPSQSTCSNQPMLRG